jgi:hypothetical protein
MSSNDILLRFLVKVNSMCLNKTGISSLELFLLSAGNTHTDCYGKHEKHGNQNTCFHEVSPFFRIDRLPGIVLSSELECVNLTVVVKQAHARKGGIVIWSAGETLPGRTGRFLLQGNVHPIR